MDLPTYEDLLARTDAPSGSSWGLFGPDDEIGTLNLLTPARVVAAASLVRRGVRFRLDTLLDAFDPPVAAHRHAHRHKIFARSDHHRDDLLDGMYLQAASHIDGFRHLAHPDHGFYNGWTGQQIDASKAALGVDRFAKMGIVGRGLLVDVGEYRDVAGRPLDHVAGEAFGVDELEGALAMQGARVEPGDILLVRTGWLAHYQTLDETGRRVVRDDLVCSGLEQSRDVLAWLWDHRVALLAADNVGVERVPPAADSPFVARSEHTAPTAHTGMMHRDLLALLGLPLGELWDLDELAVDSREHGEWACQLVVAPLRLRGGVGSPANAIAIR